MEPIHFLCSNPSCNTPLLTREPGKGSRCPKCCHFVQAPEGVQMDKRGRRTGERDWCEGERDERLDERCGKSTSASSSKLPLDDSIVARLERIETKLDKLVVRDVAKDWYSTADAATRLAKSEYTVREWCRCGQCRADKRKCYRGGKRQWMLPHEELLRLESDGPSPIGTFRLPA